MSVFSVPVTIGIDEERIVKEIEQNVETQVVNNIVKAVEEVIYNKRSYYGTKDEPLRTMIRYEIDKILKEKEDLIVNVAATKLADKLSRQKAVKEKAAAVAEEVYKE